MINSRLFSGKFPFPVLEVIALVVYFAERGDKEEGFPRLAVGEATEHFPSFIILRLTDPEKYI